MSSEGEEKWYLSHFSKYTRVVRMVACMLWFLCNATEKEQPKTSAELCTSELQGLIKQY